MTERAFAESGAPPVADGAALSLSRTDTTPIYSRRANVPSPLAFADPDYIREFLAGAGFAEVTVERAHPTIIGGSPEEEAPQALMMGPTARLIEEKKPAEVTRQTIAREIEAAFAPKPVRARSGCRRLSL